MTSPDAMQPLLTELRGLVPPADAAAVDELTRRWSGHALRVLVAGEAKRGKSTLVNRLLDRAVLPAGVVPLTAVATTVRHGPVEQVTARFTDGAVECLPLERLAELVTEPGNPGNVRGVLDVTVTLPMPLLAGGLELVDTPGVGSVHTRNTIEAAAALDRMDAAIFVLSADPPISASERDFLRQVREQAVTVFCVLNKADRLTAAELAETIAFTRQVVASELGGDVPVYALSARADLPADAGPAASGLELFRDAFTRYVAGAGRADLAQSVGARAVRLARSVQDTQLVTIAALDLSADDLTTRLKNFQKALDAVQQQRAETAAIGAAAFRQLRADTDGQAADLIARTATALVREVADRLAAVSGAPAASEADALAYAAGRIEEVIDGWRTSRAAELAAAVNALEARLTSRLTNHLQTVRDAAAQLFRVDLPTLPPPTQLAPSGRFSYAFAPDPGQVDALTTAIRHRLRGALARQQVSRYVTERTTALLDKHVGQARAAFQSQLNETHRRFGAELDRCFAEGAGRIAEAVTAVATLRRSQRPHDMAARRRAEAVGDDAARLADRIDAVTGDRNATRGAALT